MRNLMLTLMLPFLLICSSCSTTTEPAVIYQTEKVYIPLSLLKVECLPRKAGGTPRLVSAAYLSEKSCRKAYEKMTEGLIRDYTLEGTKNGQ